MKLDSKYFDCVRVKPLGEQALHENGPVCQWRGCQLPGLHRAPKGRGREGQYYFLCLDHVRAYNASYNYFEGMSEDQIYAFQKDATLGHRPTWKSGVNPGERLEAAFQRFMHGDAPAAAMAAPIKARDRQALAVLDLEHPVDKKALKARYRAMVKKHHPDMNGGDAKAEAAFKRIVQAYEYLIKHYLREQA